MPPVWRDGNEENALGAPMGDWLFTTELMDWCGEHPDFPLYARYVRESREFTDSEGVIHPLPREHWPKV